jgi:hypothetical protein
LIEAPAARAGGRKRAPVGAHLQQSHLCYDSYLRQDFLFKSVMIAIVPKTEDQWLGINLADVNRSAFH